MINSNTVSLTKKVGVTGLLLCASGLAGAAEGDVTTSFYGSLRLGLDYVDAGTADDAANGRDFLSRIGVKGSIDLGNGLSGLALVEYGLRGEDGVNFVQNNQPVRAK